MCWQGQNKKQIAEKDIPVFKIALQYPKGTICSIYRKGTTWKIGERKQLDEWDGNKPLVPLVGDVVIINSGLHSYKNEITEGRIFDGQTNMVVGIYKKGKTENLPIDSFAAFEKPSIIKLNCIIPQGGTYFENDLGEMVSDSLIPISIEVLLEGRLNKR